jgi:hypothetical protein
MRGDPVALAGNHELELVRGETGCCDHLPEEPAAASPEMGREKSLCSDQAKNHCSESAQRETSAARKNRGRRRQKPIEGENTMTKTTKTTKKRSKSTTPRTVVLGDLHGDSAALAGILFEAGLTDASGHWAGGESRLVQLGDCIDRGPDSEGVIATLQRLQAEAPPGAVVRLAGNHEMELMRGETGYCDNLRSPEGLARTLRADACAGLLVAAAAVGPWLCVHGGLRSRLRASLNVGSKASAARLAERLNEIFVAAVRADDYSHPAFGLWNEGGVFWTYGNDLVGSRQALEVPQIVGHTVTGDAFGRSGRAIFLDQGISVAMRGRWSFLEVDGAQVRWSVRERGGEWRRVARSVHSSTEAVTA